MSHQLLEYLHCQYPLEQGKEVTVTSFLWCACWAQPQLQAAEVGGRLHSPLPLWIRSLESPYQAQFLGFHSNDGARAQVARQVDLELQGSVGNYVVVAERNLPTTPHKLFKKVLAQESLAG